MSSPLQDSPAQRVILESYASDPLEAIEHHLHLEETAPPDSSTLKSTDVIIAVRSASVGWVDLLMTSGLYQHSASLPYCPGLEYSGELVWIGADVDQDRLKLGDRVMNDGLCTGARSSGDYQSYGGFSSFAVAPENGVFSLPPHFTFAQGCNLLGSYETAYHCLIANGQLQAGETVLIHGASGSTGLAAVHLAKLIGATVIATGRDDQKLKIVKEQGADYVINSRGDERRAVRRFRDEVKALTGGEGVDVVYDGVGGGVSLESLRCVKFGARYLIVGWASTPFVARGEQGKPNPNMLPTNLIMMKGLRVLGCPMVISTQKNPSIRVDRLRQLFSWCKSELIHPHISHQFPLSQFKEAMYAKWGGEVIGGCVLTL